MVTVSGNPNPTNPSTKYRCEFDNLNCLFAICLTWLGLASGVQTDNLDPG